MKELVVISGKGGTGKTSMVAAFASLASGVVCADCDVDAANLHLVSHPVTRETRNFFGGYKASVSMEVCTACGRCLEVCRYGAVTKGEGYYSIDPLHCEGCGVCAWSCPAGAVTTEPGQNGEWYISDTANGPLVHARLFPGSENSGKLVTQVRKAARKEAQRTGARIMIVDG
ncbi:MAG TPA: 4Fe-4S binding protein, partial [Candidatus Krumholzibacterium sp.]|nr:4Fe-4S binding protein [Candidatus Krumholzibacterium sp.]